MGFHCRSGKSGDCLEKLSGNLYRVRKRCGLLRGICRLTSSNGGSPEHRLHPLTCNAYICSLYVIALIRLHRDLAHLPLEELEAGTVERLHAGVWWHVDVVRALKNVKGARLVKQPEEVDQLLEGRQYMSLVLGLVQVEGPNVAIQNHRELMEHSDPSDHSVNTGLPLYFNLQDMYSYLSVTNSRHSILCLICCSGAARES